MKVNTGGLSSVSTRPVRRNVQPDQFVARCPRLWHLAHADAWPGLQRRGLLSTASLVSLFGRQDAETLLRQPRPESVRLEHPVHGIAVLRNKNSYNPQKADEALTVGQKV